MLFNNLINSQYKDEIYMVLIIGGARNGKLSYVLEKTGIQPAEVACDFASAESSRVLNALQDAIRRALAVGADLSALVDRLLERSPGVIVICDEVGGGVVPVGAEERVWREAVGRVCCTLAERADYVERVFCGIPMRLKGEGEWS